MLKIKKMKYGIYGTVETNDESMKTLGEFLIDSVGPYVDRVKDDLFHQCQYNGNSSTADRYGEVISIMHSYFDELPKFIISFHNFINLLDQWKIVYASKPSEIIITMDYRHEHFTIEAIP
jgi:hypothetical protein